MRILQRFSGEFSGSPFTAAIQIRFKKPANTAQTRLETRTLDSKLDRVAFHRRRLALALNLYKLISTKKRGPFISLQLISRWAPLAGLRTLSGGKFVRKYPHIFEVFTHPLKRNLCCRFTKKFTDLINLDEATSSKMEEANLIKLRKILSMSIHGRVHIHAIRLIRTELGLPQNFVDTLIRNHDEIFRMVDPEIVELVNWDNEEEEEAMDETQRFTAEIEKWREKEYKEKWLSEYETKYAFPINFPTGFRIVPGFREKLKIWQRLQYIKPYQRTQKVSSRSCGGMERYEKRAVGIIHELLHLTVEKMMDMERLSHFRKDLGIEINVREVLLKHPGIFYLSTRGDHQILFLREAYEKGILIHSDEIEMVRRKMLELLLMGRRFTRKLKGGDEDEDLDRMKNGMCAQ